MSCKELMGGAWVPARLIYTTSTMRNSLAAQELWVVGHYQIERNQVV